MGVENAGVEIVAPLYRGGNRGNGILGTKYEGWKTREWKSREKKK